MLTSIDMTERIDPTINMKLHMIVNFFRPNFDMILPRGIVMAIKIVRNEIVIQLSVSVDNEKSWYIFGRAIAIIAPTKVAVNCVNAAIVTINFFSFIIYY